MTLPCPVRARARARVGCVVAGVLSGGMLLGLQAGCGVVPPIPVFQHVNERVSEGATEMLVSVSPQPATGKDPRVPRASERPGRAALQGDAFVGVGMSGGGARAANFGAAVLQQLETLGLMPRVTVLSSVSGGGLPTAWYALHGPSLTADNTAAWDGLHAAMRQDLRQEWQHTVLAPHHLLATFMSGLNRSDLMTEVFERRLFHGATFGDLGPVGPRKPVVLFNATDITREGVGFAFSEEEFSARNSRLDSFPIARAVMASGAFPGAFSSITLRNHPPRRPDGTTDARATYTHLMDGGPADNHGIDKLLQAARSAWQRSPARERFACLMVVVDAHVANHASERVIDRDLRNAPLDYLVDPNVFEAIDTLLVQRRTDSLARLGLAVPAGLRDRRPEPGRFHFAQAEGGLERLVWHYDRVVDFDLPVKDIDPQARAPRCRAWHIALNELRSITTGIPVDAAGVPDIAHPVQRHRAALWEAASRIKTDYRLVGPPACDALQLQGLLHRAAEVAVREDLPALDGVCQWLGQHVGQAAQATCLAGRRGARAPALPLRITADLDAVGTQLRCTAPASELRP